MNHSILESIGLTKSEINVYLALLELGSSTTGPIVDKSQAASSKIYEILDRLAQKGLVSYVIKAGTKYFEAADPQRLLDYVQEKEEQLKQQKHELATVLPELKLKQTLSKYKSEAQIYKGMKGLDTAFKDVFKVCKKGDELYVFVVGELDERLNAFFIRQYTERAKRGITTKTIFSEAGRTYYESRKNLPYFEGKVIGTTSSPATVQVYGNKVNLRIGGADNVVCMIIDNKQLAQSFKEQFDALWNQKVHVFEGQKQATLFFKNILTDLHAGDEYFVINGNYGGLKVLRDFFIAYHPQRSALGIKAHFLFNQNVKKHVHKLALPPAEYQFLPPDFKSPLQISFYKNKLYISLWEENAIGFLIESERLVKAFKAYFDTLWNQKGIKK
ncbi:MAG: helix-turn-helix domain-containing protein [Candidatus Woesearchaeota archaeon]|nr:helix-turn-helix domain-containing protein [Candidatus Woesearchaeota archaeon]